MSVPNSTSWTYSDNICGNLDLLFALILKSPTIISTYLDNHRMSSMVDCLICIIPSFSGEHLQIAILKLRIDTQAKSSYVIEVMSF